MLLTTSTWASVRPLFSPRAVAQLRKKMGQTKTFKAFEQYVGLDRPAHEVADALSLHITTVYKAKEKITQLLRDAVARLNEED